MLGLLQWSMLELPSPHIWQSRFRKCIWTVRKSDWMLENWVYEHVDVIYFVSMRIGTDLYSFKKRRALPTSCLRSILRCLYVINKTAQRMTSERVFKVRTLPIAQASELTEQICIRPYRAVRVLLEASTGSCLTFGRGIYCLAIWSFFSCAWTSLYLKTSCCYWFRKKLYAMTCI